jgi:signal transduction histidine kinase
MRWLLRAWITGVVLLLAAAPDAAYAQPKRILLLHSFGPNFSPWNVIAGRLREELFAQSPQPIDLYEASLQMDRFGPDQDRGPFAEYLRTLFSARDLDLIIAIGAPAARFILAQRPNLFAATPLLVAGTDERTFADTPLTANDTTVPVIVDESLMVHHIMQVLPDTGTMAVVIGDSPLERYWADLVGRSLERFKDRLKVEWLNKLTLDEMVNRVALLPPHSAIYYATMRVDVKGIPHEDDRVLEKLHAAARAPIFSYIDNSFGRGIVGGPLLSSQEIAQKSAAVAVRILGGEKPGTINTSPIGPATPIYDWRELRRWNISEAQLPPGSAVMFREPTTWQLYRWQMLGVLAIVLLQAATIAWLLFERKRRRVAELEARGRLLEVIHLNRSAEVGALSSSFAHELMQPLASISLNVDAADMYLRSDPPNVGGVREIVEDIREANQRASQIILHMRKLLKRAKDAELHDVDLGEVVTEVVQILVPEARKRKVALKISDGGPLLVRADRIQLQQVLLNLVTNAMDAIADGDAAPGTVTVETAPADGSYVVVTVSDTGPGVPYDKLNAVFDAFYSTKESGTGLGLLIARTIVESFGGKIWAENRAGGGAVFRFTLLRSDHAT